MRRKDFYVDGEQARLQVVMLKTKRYVFEVPSNATVNVVLKSWAKEAGISKHIMVYTAKYTFAMMMKTLRTDQNGKSGLVNLE